MAAGLKITMCCSKKYLEVVPNHSSLVKVDLFLGKGNFKERTCKGVAVFPHLYGKMGQCHGRERKGEGQDQGPKDLMDQIKMR